MTALAALLAATGTAPTGAQPSDLAAAVQRYVAANQRTIVGELVELLSIPNVAADKRQHPQERGVPAGMLERRGLTAELLETDGNPLVYGELKVPDATRTLLLYAHYDGQPVNPPTGSRPMPFTPILRDGRHGRRRQGAPDARARAPRFEADWRIYARSASDDKSPIVALIDRARRSQSDRVSSRRRTSA